MFGVLSQALLGVFAAVVPAATRGNHAVVRLVAGPPVVGSAKEQWLGLEFRLTPGWHVYWRNPGDAGSPPAVAWTVPAHWQLGALEWPLPSRIDVPPLAAFGYEDHVVYPMRLRTADGQQAGTIVGHVSWVVCKVECIAEEDSVVLRFTAGTSPPADRAIVASAVARLPSLLPAAWLLSARSSGGDLSLVVEGASRDTITSADFFPADPGVIEHAARVDVAVSAERLTLRLTRSRYAAAAPDTLRGLLVVHRGDRDTLPASYDISVPVNATQLVSASGTSPVMLLALALLSGLLVNLMPCVFPLLAIKALSLTSHATAAAERFVRAAMYIAGSVLSSAALGGSLIVANGREHGAWGFQMQSPRFLGLVALVTFGAGLSLLGVFELPSLWPRSLGGRTNRTGARVGAFTTGAAAILVGAPCTAPFFGATLTGALSASREVGLAVFLAFGVAAAAPLAALTLSPGLLRYLPKPGRWMETTKQLLAFPLLAGTAWLVWIAQLQTGASGSAVLLASLCAVAFALWILGRWWTLEAPTAARRIALVAGVGITAVAVHRVGGLEVAATPIAGSPSDAAAWQPFSDARLDSLRSAGRAVLVDFTAAWCLTCKVNEVGALSSDRFRDLVRARAVGLLRADLTVPDSALSRALHGVGAASVPTYVLYSAGTSGAWELLPPLLTPGIVTEAIDRATSSPRPRPVASSSQSSHP